jgi:ABC-type glycerol-3-phosphate transport system substrate-binding protein
MQAHSLKKLAAAGLLAAAAVWALPSQAATEITFWHVWSGPRLPMVKDMIAAFEKAHPDIKVTDSLIDQGDMAQKYLTAIAGGNPPDVIMVHSARFFPAFAEKGVLVDLTPFVTKDKMKLDDIFYPSDVANYVWDGKVMGLPLATDSGGWNLYYDVDEFKEAGLDPDKPPTTWQELEDYAKKLTVKNGDKIARMGFSPMGTENYPFKEWLTLNNGKFISDDGKKVLFNSPEGLATMEWIVGFYDRLYGGFDKVIDLAGQNQPSGRNEKAGWYNGQIAMHVDGVWHQPQLEADAPKKNVRAALMPYNGANPDAKLRNLGGVGWSYSIPVGAKHVDAAWQFVKYTTAGPGNQMFFKAQLRPSPVKAYNDDPELAAASPFWKVFLQNGAATVPAKNVPVQAEVDRVVVEMTDLALLHKKTPQQAIADGAAQIQGILDEYWAGK